MNWQWEQICQSYIVFGAPSVDGGCNLNLSHLIGEKCPAVSCPVMSIVCWWTAAELRQTAPTDSSDWWPSLLSVAATSQAFLATVTGTGVTNNINNGWITFTATSLLTSAFFLSLCNNHATHPSCPTAARRHSCCRGIVALSFKIKPTKKKWDKRNSRY